MQPCCSASSRHVEAASSTVEDLASQIPDASGAIETTVIGAIRRGLLGGLINEQPLMDGPIITVSYIRG